MRPVAVVDASDGAFTGARRGGRVGLVEAADGGTLFLDEIGELPLPLQTRLLRVLEEREVLRVGATEPTPVDLRVVAATLQSLEQRAAAGSFRRDLYYRLAALRIALPALRARRSDIALLTRHFFRQLRGIDAPLDEAAMTTLTNAEWPGNVRELRNLVDRLRIHWQPGEELINTARLMQLAPELMREGTPAMPVESNGKRPPRAQLEAVLQEHRNDREGMAQALGVSRTTLWRWLLQFGARCNARHWLQSTRARGALLDDSRRRLAEWVQAHALDCEFDARGLDYVASPRPALVVATMRARIRPSTIAWPARSIFLVTRSCGRIATPPSWHACCARRAW
ncbi:hypothetical protein G6F65_016758 [Rhizopus arrhizus]|nr:hypothetical protein G6F65_016758 [Rhizopus arrhizus]